MRAVPTVLPAAVGKAISAKRHGQHKAINENAGSRFEARYRQSAARSGVDEAQPLPTLAFFVISARGRAFCAVPED